MAVAIRLSRGGAKKRPYYRIVVADSRAARDGKYLEQIGTYNPVLAKDNPDRVKLNEELGATPGVGGALDDEGRAVGGERVRVHAQEAVRRLDEGPVEQDRMGWVIVRLRRSSRGWSIASR